MSDAGGDAEAPNTDTGGGDADAAGGGDAARDGGEGAVTEVSQESCCGQMGNALTGACFGFLLFFGAIGLLIYNEGRTVKRAKDLDEGREVVLELNLDQYNSTSHIPKDMFANQLVHAVGNLSTSDTLMDPVFGVGGSNSNSSNTADGPLKLSRSVEMYQWKESSSTRTIKTAGGGTRTSTTYSYKKQWLTYIEDSSNFHNSDYKNKNPTQFPFPELLLTADPIWLGNGGIQLSSDVASYLNWYEPVDSVSLEDVVDSSLKSQLDIFQSNGIYYHTYFNAGATNGSSSTSAASSSVDNPMIGDARYRFDQVPPDTISVIAVYLTNDSVDTYTTSRGGALLLVKRGNVTAAEMFQQADDENTTLAWILRFVGFFLMVVSILLILQPLATAVDIIPFIGDFLQGGLEGCLFPLIAVLIALPVSLFTVALAWLAYRPVWSVPMMALSGGIMAWLYCRAKKAKQDADENSNDDDDNSVGKPPSTNYGNDTAAASSYPYGSSDNYGGNAETTNNYNSGVGSYQTGGFAGALDNPPPTAHAGQWSADAAIPIVEPDVVMGQPYYSTNVGANQPFVPQQYKP